MQVRTSPTTPKKLRYNPSFSIGVVGNHSRRGPGSYVKNRSWSGVPRGVRLVRLRGRPWTSPASLWTLLWLVAVSSEHQRYEVMSLGKR